MYTTRLSRYKRNRKYAAACVGRHSFREDGSCTNCGHIHRGRRRRYINAQRAAAGLDKLARQLTNAGQSFGQRVKGVFDKKN